MFIQHSITLGFVLPLCSSYVVADSPFLLFAPLLFHPVLMHNCPDASETHTELSYPTVNKAGGGNEKNGRVSYQPTSGHYILCYVIIPQSLFSPLLYLICILCLLRAVVWAEKYS